MSTSATIVGGGLAGLIAAATLAEEGVDVQLFEASSLGGRARSAVRGGATLNLGPHALYRRGAARSALRRFGLRLKGGRPPLSALGLHQGRLQPLPFTPLAAASTPLLQPAQRIAAAAFMGAWR